jgi:hypothetical protein
MELNLSGPWFSGPTYENDKKYDTVRDGNIQPVSRHEQSMAENAEFYHDFINLTHRLKLSRKQPAFYDQKANNKWSACQCDTNTAIEFRLNKERKNPHKNYYHRSKRHPFRTV